MKKAKRAMWLARDENGRCGRGVHRLHARSAEPVMLMGQWVSEGDEGLVINPDQSPISLEPGAGPVRVWLVAK